MSDVTAYFAQSPGAEQVQEVLKVLQSDVDRDVKFFAGGCMDPMDDFVLDQVSILSPLSMASLCLESSTDDDNEHSSPSQLRV